MPRSDMSVWALCVEDDLKITYQTLEDTLTSRCTAGLYLPQVVLCNLVQLELVRDLLWTHGTGNVLLVREHQEKSILHLTVLDDASQLGSCLVNTVAVVRVNNEDQSLGAYAMNMSAIKIGPSAISSKEAIVDSNLGKADEAEYRGRRT